MTQNKNEQLNWDKLIKGQVVLWEIKQQIKQKQQKSGGVDTFLQSGVITISRTHGACGDYVAREISRQLNWQIYDKEIVEYIAQSGQVRNRLVEDFDERKKNETETWVQTIFDKHALGIDKYFRLLHDIILSIAEQGQAIIIGRGSNFIVNPNKALRVMITAPLETRIKHIMEDQNLSLKEARKTVALVDSNRFAYVHRYFHRDANDHTAYDLVLNVNNMNHMQAADIIIQSLRRKMDITEEKMQHAGFGLN